MMDKYMCTKICPCYDYATKKGRTYEMYFKKEKELRKRGRSFNDKDKSVSPMVFTNDFSVGFRNFDKCYSYWYMRSIYQKNVDMSIVFDMRRSHTEIRE